MFAPKWFLLSIGLTTALPFFSDGRVHEWWAFACLPYALAVAALAAWVEHRAHRLVRSPLARLVIATILAALVVGAVLWLLAVARDLDAAGPWIG